MWLILMLFVVVWPFVAVLTRHDVPSEDRCHAAVSFVWALVLTVPVALAVLMSPLMVPLALWHTRWDDDELPWWARPWDNDVSINGDREEYWAKDYKGTTYYVNAHPRSWQARLVWLLFRNRASWLAKKFGHRWSTEAGWSQATYGDPLVSRSHEGWQLNHRDGYWQFYATKRLWKLCLRMNLGWKIWAKSDGRAVANVVWIPLTVVSWQGD